MEQQMQFIGFSYEEAERFLKTVVNRCIEENQAKQKGNQAELPITPSQASKALKVSAPTLRRYVRLGLIRRHDLGPRRKVFYLSELEEDVKRVEASAFTHR